MSHITDGFCRKSIFKKVKSILFVILTLALVALLVGFFISKIFGNAPTLLGYRLLRVSSSSMSPELEVGDIILSKEVKDASILKVGDVVTYKGETGSYSGKLITHEVVNAPYYKGDKLFLVTKGVANERDDPEISAESVVGKTVCVVPLLGTVYDFFMSVWGLVLIIGILTFLFIAEFRDLKAMLRKESEQQNSEG